MTNKEAAEMIRNDIKLHHDSLSGGYRKALSMAIAALEAQEIRDLLPVSPLLDKKKKKRKREAISAPQPQELSNNSPKLDKENGDLQPTCNNLETDTISRQAAIDALMEIDRKLRKVNWYEHPDANYECQGVDWAIARIGWIPSAQPERKKGKWHHYEGMYTCDQCGSSLDDISPFCPMCGSDMREEESNEGSD